MNIKILDCTLRDGGYVNDFAFGEESKRQISNALIAADVDIVELGFLKNGIHSKELSVYNRISEAEIYINEISNNQLYCLMIRPDWYDISLLERATKKINTLRFAFHARDIDLALSQALRARDLGYSVYLNPVNVTSYSEENLANLLRAINVFKPEGVSIVDTFGSLLPKSFRNILSIFHQHLDNEITLGLHLHENLSLAMGLATNFIYEMSNERNLIIDSSLLGMGRVPGNLCTELIAGLLNVEFGATYNMRLIYEILSTNIQPLREKFVWGYLPSYAKTGFDKVHRDYAEYMMEKTSFSISQIYDIIDRISKDNIGNEFKESLVLKYLNI
jgi:4-hydroxy 2-oxovalerate aldolase